MDNSFVADFDGDGKADRAYVRANSANDGEAVWFVVSTATGAPGVPGIPWGSKMAPGIPANGRFFVADFDGDGKADRAFVRATSATDGDGCWYVVSTASGAPGVSGIPWGSKMAPGMPANGRYYVADFDGDKKADRMFINDAGDIYIVSTSTGPVIPGWLWGKKPNGWPALSGAQFFVADVNGDGKADLIMVNQAGQWYAVSGTNSPIAENGFKWGQQFPGWPGNGRFYIGDFDGDGKADRAYLRDNDAAWHAVGTGSGAPGIVGIPWGSQPYGWPLPSSIRK